jgi:hypothetical protein
MDELEQEARELEADLEERAIPRTGSRFVQPRYSFVPWMENIYHCRIGFWSESTMRVIPAGIMEEG